MKRKKYKRRASALDYAITPTPEYRKEWEEHNRLFKDAGRFEDDPKAETADTYGCYESRSAGMDGIQQITGVDDLWGNGEPTG